MKMHTVDGEERRCVAEQACPLGSQVEKRTWAEEVLRRRGGRTEAEYREYRRKYLAERRDAARGKK